MFFWHNGKGWIAEHGGKIVAGPHESFDALMNEYFDALAEAQAEVNEEAAADE